MFVLFAACAEPGFDVIPVPPGSESTPTGGGGDPVQFIDVFEAGTPGPAADWSCDGSRDADWQDWPGGLRMRLTTDPLQFDTPSTLTATGAVPGDVVVFHTGSLCALDCPAERDGACFQGVASEVLGEAVADEAGVASLVVTPDGAWYGRWFVLQASVESGRYLSQPVVDRGGPWFGPMFPVDLPMAIGPATLRKVRLVDEEWFLVPVAPGRRARLTLDCPGATCASVERSVTAGSVQLVQAPTTEPFEAWFADASTWLVHSVGGGDDYSIDLELLPAEAPVAWYADADGDGWGDALAAPVFSTTPVPGATTALDDCDDGDPARHPAAPEVCDDGVDHDCDGADRPCGRGGDPWTPGTAGTYVAGEALARLGAVMHSGDVDGDGSAELVIGGQPFGTRAHGAIVDLADRRDREPGEAWSWPSEYGLADVEVGDVDGDGADDLLVAPLAGGSELRSYLGPLAPGEPWQSAASLVSGSSPGAHVEIGRLVDDADPDLVFTHADLHTAHVVLLADPAAGGPSAFGVQISHDPAWLGPWDAVVDDLDGDGVDDLVTSPGCLFLGPLPGPLACLDAPRAGPLITGVAAEDVDGDGRPDLAVAIGSALYLRTEVWRDGAAVADGAWGSVDSGEDVLGVRFLRGDELQMLVIGPTDVRAVTLDGPGAREATDVWMSYDVAPSLWAADLDGDGFTDLAVGRPSVHDEDLPSAGGVWVVWGP